MPLKINDRLSGSAGIVDVEKEKGDSMGNIKLFESKQVRSVWNETDQKWYFSIADVILALTDTVNVKDYIKKMRKRDPELNSNWGTFCPSLELIAPDGETEKNAMRQFRKSASHYPIHTLTQGRAFQALAGAGRLRAA